MLFRSVLVFVLLAMLTPSPASAPQRFLGLTRSAGQIPYDGRFILARLYYPFYPAGPATFPRWRQLREDSAIAVAGAPTSGWQQHRRMDDPELLSFNRLFVGAGLLVSERIRSRRTAQLHPQGGFLWSATALPNEWQVRGRDARVLRTARLNG
jgi:hypothetical protein